MCEYVHLLLSQCPSDISCNKINFLEQKLKRFIKNDEWVTNVHAREAQQQDLDNSEFMHIEAH